jgi:hypothetical protein
VWRLTRPIWAGHHKSSAAPLKMPSEGSSWRFERKFLVKFTRLSLASFECTFIDFPAQPGDVHMHSQNSLLNIESSINATAAHEPGTLFKYQERKTSLAFVPVTLCRNSAVASLGSRLVSADFLHCWPNSTCLFMRKIYAFSCRPDLSPIGHEAETETESTLHPSSGGVKQETRRSTRREMKL